MADSSVPQLQPGARLLLVARPDIYQGSGGDLVQIRKTAQYLHQLGHVVHITHDLSPDYRRYDLAHFFTLATWHQLKRAETYGIPRVLSPIYWDPRKAVVRSNAESSLGVRVLRRLAGSPDAAIGLASYAIADMFRGVRHRTPPRELANTVVLRTKTRRTGRDTAYRGALEAAQLLLPNAELEMHHIAKQFEVRRPYVVVPNGADASLFVPSSSADWNSRFGVVCVAARINHRKNQAALIAALRGTGIPLTIVGRAFDSEERRYLRDCRRLAGSSVTFINQVAEEDLQGLYSRARVHALLSWFETPGLVSIEAAIAGCNIVATREGTAEEYFGDRAVYAPPDDLETIRTRVIAAHTEGWDARLQRRCRRLYTWDRVARLTGAAYARMLA